MIAALDLLLLLALISAACWIRLPYAKGDLWLDEADYATAGARGVEANRWDTSDRPSEPDRLLKQRHYHPPLAALLADAGFRSGHTESALRTPAVAAGCATIALVYLCGLRLFVRRGEPKRPLVEALETRAIALACAGAAMVIPAHIRASAHALPWAFITLWLVGMLWCILSLCETGSTWWLLPLGACLGGMFVTSEYFLPACAALALTAPSMVLTARRRGTPWWHALLHGLGGSALCLAIAEAYWPAGLRGHVLVLLNHYAAMSGDSWPVTVMGQTYDRAPKWAYAFWYATQCPALTAFWIAGTAAAIGLAVSRKLGPGGWALLGFTVVIGAVAHKSHIIGPEYLPHLTVLLCLVGGLALVVLARIGWAASLAGAVAVILLMPLTTRQGRLPGADRRERVTRWAPASRYLAGVWKRGDSMLAPAYGTVGRWYLLHYAGVSVEEWRVQAVPAQGASAKLLADVDRGTYRYVAVGSTFSDRPYVDSRILGKLATWGRVWVSDEQGSGPTRLTIYRRPDRPVPPREAPPRSRPRTR